MKPRLMPDLSAELAKRIRLVRRDVSDLLFHFTRSIHPAWVEIHFAGGGRSMPGSASNVLRKILYEGRLLGSSRWTYGYNTVCFTEAPIQEFNSIFSLVTSLRRKTSVPGMNHTVLPCQKSGFLSKVVVQ
jgi:hypothetical protein